MNHELNNTEEFVASEFKKLGVKAAMQKVEELTKDIRAHEKQLYDIGIATYHKINNECIYRKKELCDHIMWFENNTVCTANNCPLVDFLLNR